TTVKINLAPTQNTFTFPTSLTGTYSGGGILTRVSRIDIRTKEFNFYLKDGRNFHVPEIDFQVDATPVEAQGQIAVDYYISTNDISMTAEAIGTNTIVGTGVLETFPYPNILFESNSS